MTALHVAGFRFNGRRKWKHDSLEAFMSRGRRRNVINFHSISRVKSCSFEGFMRETLRVSSGAVAAFHPGYFDLFPD